MKIKLPSSIVFILVSMNINADDSIFDLSLEDLADIEVSISTKVVLPLSLSPATVSVYQSEQLYQSGINQLADLADISSGYASYSIYGERVLETRGQKAGSFENNKHLVLLDGIRLNHARSNKAPIENELPLFMLDKVEVLRGPASALYGQSAFYGVMSLDSAFNESNDFITQLDLQTQGNGFRVGVFGNYHSQIGHSFLTYSQFDKQSEDELVGPNFSTLQTYYDDQKSDFIYARQAYETKNWGDFTGGYIELNRQGGLGEHWNGDYSHIENDIKWQTQISYIQWQKIFNHDFKTTLKLINNDSQEQGVGTNNAREQVVFGDEVTFSAYLVDVNSKLAEAEVIWQMDEKQSSIFGLSYEKRQDLGGYFIDEFDVNNSLADSEKQAREKSDYIFYQSAYFQYFDLLTNWWDIYLTAGIRYDKGEYLTDKFSQISPRISLVKQLNKQWVVRGSYSSALRSPGLKEYLLNDESQSFILENALAPEQAINTMPDSLKAETFKSTELSVSYSHASFLLKLNGFYNKTENALDGKPIHFIDVHNNLVSKNAFMNSLQAYSVYGGELEVQWRLAENWHLSAFINHVTPTSASKEATIDNAKLRFQGAITGKLPWFNINVIQNYNTDISGKVDHIASVDVTLSKIIDKFNWYLKATNLTNRQDYYSINGDLGNPLPGRSLEFGLNYKIN